MDISNKTLVMFIVVSIVVSVAGTMISLNKLNKFTVPTTTGHATSNATATTTLTITTSAGLVFITGNDSVAWGIGYVNTASNNQRCNLTTWTGANYNSDYCLGFANVSNNLTMENQGSIALEIEINSSTDANGFLGGAGPIFQAVARNSSIRAGCIGTLNTTAQTMNGNFRQMCSSLDYLDAQDRLDLIPNISFDYSASGAKSATIFAVGTY